LNPSSGGAKIGHHNITRRNWVNLSVTQLNFIKLNALNNMDSEHENTRPCTAASLQSNPTHGVSPDVMHVLLVGVLVTPFAWATMAFAMATGDGSWAQRNLFIVCAICGFVSLAAFTGLLGCAIYNWLYYRRSLGYLICAGILIAGAVAFGIAIPK